MIAMFDDNECGCHCACCQRHECSVQRGSVRPIYREPAPSPTITKGLSTGGNATTPTIWYTQQQV